MDIPPQYSYGADPYRPPEFDGGARRRGGFTAGLRGMGAANWARLLAGVTVGGLVLLMAVHNRDVTRDPRVALTSLAPGTCYVIDDRDKVSDDAGQSTFDYPGRVRTVPCTQPHRGEVVAQVSLPHIELRTQSALVRAALASCQLDFADYNPDPWSLPQNVLAAPIYPKFRDLDTGGRSPASMTTTACRSVRRCAPASPRPPSSASTCARCGRTTWRSPPGSTRRVRPSSANWSTGPRT